jgi:hypothetical protein
MMGQAKLRKAEIEQLKTRSPKDAFIAFGGSLNPVCQNFYTIHIDMDASTLREWLTKNGCPKAAASIRPGTTHKSTYDISGNVSAMNQIAVFIKLGISHECVPVGNSQPLKNIPMVFA